MQVERAYLVAYSGFEEPRSNPAGGSALWESHYYIEELPGTGLDAKLEAALKFFSTTNPANGQLTQDALPAGSRHAIVSCVGFNMLGSNRTPSGMEFLKLVQSSNEGEWTVLQSKARPNFNNRDAYVAIRRTEELVVLKQGEPILANLGGALKKVSDSLCLTKRGTFELLGNLGQLIENDTNPPRFDPDAWRRRSLD